MGKQEFDRASEELWRDEVTFHQCALCGWWFVDRYAEGHIITGVFGGRAYNQDYGSRSFGRSAVLREFSGDCIDLPIDEVRRFLLARYDARYEVHPRVLEEVVGSVFRDHGYEVDVTAYQNDGGIDAVLASADGDRIAVQVKRYRDNVKVEQVRSLAGAMLLHGVLRGIFVTTSAYQRGCHSTADAYAAVGYPIELIDGERFLAALKIAQRPQSYSPAEIARFTDVSTMHLLAQDIGSCSNTTSIPLE